MPGRALRSAYPVLIAVPHVRREIAAAEWRRHVPLPLPSPLTGAPCRLRSPSIRLPVPATRKVRSAPPPEHVEMASWNPESNVITAPYARKIRRSAASRTPVAACVCSSTASLAAEGRPAEKSATARRTAPVNRISVPMIHRGMSRARRIANVLRALHPSCSPAIRPIRCPHSAAKCSSPRPLCPVRRRAVRPTHSSFSIRHRPVCLPAAQGHAVGTSAKTAEILCALCRV